MTLRKHFGIQRSARAFRPRLRRIAAGAGACVLVTVCGGDWGLRAELLDRLVAVVGSRPILDSDVRLARSLRLVELAPGEGDDLVVGQLIDRSLMLDEVDRFGPSEPDAAEVAARFDAVRARVGAATLADVLERTGVPEPALRGWLRDDIRIEQYLMQRFNAVAQPTSDEVARYYDDHREAFTTAGTLQPLVAVEAGIQQALAAARRAELIAEWQQSLRRRARVRLLPLVDESAGGPRGGGQLP